jgi:hypothetical protein
MVGGKPGGAVGEGVSGVVLSGSAGVGVSLGACSTDCGAGSAAASPLHAPGIGWKAEFMRASLPYVSHGPPRNVGPQ